MARGTTLMADDGLEGALRGDSRTRVAGRGGAVPAGSLHDRGAGGDGAQVGGGAPGGSGAAVSGGRAADARVDDDGDTGRALASARRGWLPAGARPAEGGDVDRLTIAVPVKGRLREPSVSLLEDAGLGPEQPGERALAFPCRNAPVDVLLVRAADIPEYVQDGVVDCGITGQDLVRERGARVEELLELGYGSCRLEAAVPEESRFRTLEDLAGATIATVYPRLARELMPVEVELVDVTGSVEIAPRLGLAEGIVDLVSSGNTLRTNGLRSLGQLFSSQAVLIGKLGGDASQLVSMMRAVVEARAHRYLMLNTPESRLEEVCEIIGSRSPSVLPLAEPGMVAVHALVPSAEVWRLLPELESAGASSILVVPVERMSRVSIVAEIKREGDDAVRRWRSSSTAPSLRARFRSPSCSLARRCSTWPTASAGGTRPSGPPISRSRSSPESCSNGAGFRSGRSASTSRAISSRRS